MLSQARRVGDEGKQSACKRLPGPLFRRQTFPCCCGMNRPQIVSAEDQFGHIGAREGNDSRQFARWREALYAPPAEQGDPQKTLGIDSHAIGITGAFDMYERTLA